MKVRLAALTAVLVVAAGCGFGGKDDDKASGSAPTVAVTSESPVPEESPTPEPVETTTAPAPKPSKTSSKPKKTRSSPTPTGPVNNFQAASCTKAPTVKNVSKAKAKAALNAAATKIYWPGSAPTLKVPADLVRAVAWHESGWQSAIENCDGGYGLMQVMPDTEAFINQRFEQSYDYKDYRQNAIIGANQLAWLTKYFGHLFFKDKYDLSTSKCRTDSSPCLLNLVIDGYNMGFGNTETAYRDGKRLSNPEYVAIVRANMRSCFCDNY
ncbi:transglycosylase SLT domain-containing protein [Actinoplanes oblitus]|uniref:Transglycosylase SLT domain-containing protein n=1 Tax=Actinoplanes oblitus TaxID=3040509 RepID=A0ABY8WM88_9ACTN|nr:transglycosylase SLT domain-containing protein [Actinoplanes oblitus]WIM98208.1 transglycosylase SLT domain-containing protein [Actinoplanes oblitus]